MSGFKEPSFADRQKAAQQARQDILNKFRSQPGPDDPAVKQRQAEREAQAVARAKAKEARQWAEKIITLAKRGDLHARRQTMAVVRSKKAHTRLTVDFVARTQGGNQRKILPVVGAKEDTYNSW